MEAITAWLKGARNYQVGVQLYNHYGSDPGFKALINSERETPFKKEKLIKALRAIADGSLAVKKEEEAQRHETSISVATEASFRKQWPLEACKSPDEKKLWEKAVEALKLRAFLHASLFHQLTDEARRKVAFQILRVDEQLNEVYGHRKYLQQHGHLPDQEDTGYVTDPFAMAKRIENLQRYLRRVTDPAKRQQYVKEYNHYAKLMGKKEVEC